MSQQSNGDTPLNRVRRGLINLERTDPFFSSIIFNLKLIEIPSINTMATNGKILKYNPEFVNDCDQAKLDVVLVHESGHVALGHPLLLGRLPDHNAALIAAELAVNSLIHERKGFPEDALLPGRGLYIKFPLGKNVEWYYAKIKEQEKANGRDQKEETNNNDNASSQADGSDTETNEQENYNDSSQADEAKSSGKTDKEDSASEVTSLGAVEPYALGDETEQEATQTWEQIVSDAANSAAGAGNLPGAFEELVDRLLGTTALPWPVLLRLFLTRNVRHGRSYRRPNRRSLWRSDIQPSRMTKGLGKMVLGVDTSGSMDQDEMNKALSTCIDIGKVYPNFELGIVEFDTQIAHVEWFNRFNANKEYFKDWTWKGRGGTSYKSFFDKLPTYNANIVVVVTDGYPNDDWPDMRNIRVPVIWLITKEAIIPDNVSKHSRVIRLNS